MTYYLVNNRQPMLDPDKPHTERFETERRAMRFATSLTAKRVDVIRWDEDKDAGEYVARGTADNPIQYNGIKRSVRHTNRGAKQ